MDISSMTTNGFFKNHVFILNKIDIQTNICYGKIILKKNVKKFFQVK